MSAIALVLLGVIGTVWVSKDYDDWRAFGESACPEQPIFHLLATSLQPNLRCSYRYGRNTSQQKGLHQDEEGLAEEVVAT